MTCVSLTACRTEQHELAPCRDCGARVCALTLEHSRCLDCIARRLRIARAEGRVDAFGLPTGPTAERVDEDGPWGVALRDLDGPAPRLAPVASPRRRERSDRDPQQGSAREAGHRIKRAVKSTSSQRRA